MTGLCMSWMVLTQWEEHPAFLSWWEETEWTAWPLRDARCLLCLFPGCFPQGSDNTPCRELWFGRGPFCEHWLWGCVCILHHSLPSGPFWYRPGYMLRVSTKQGSASKIFTEKVLKRKRKHSISHSQGTKNCLGCWHALFWFSIWTVIGLAEECVITEALLRLQTSYSDLANGPVPQCGPVVREGRSDPLMKDSEPEPRSWGAWLLCHTHPILSTHGTVEGKGPHQGVRGLISVSVWQKTSDYSWWPYVNTESSSFAVPFSSVGGGEDLLRGKL